MHRYPRLHEAVDYAAEAHKAQARKGTSNPYLSHPIGVSSLVLENGGDEEQAIAALLHDVLEDCGGHHEGLIRAAFGDRVAGMVIGCTDGLPDESGEKPPWADRKRAYLQHLQATDLATLLVSACDKLHNARAIANDLEAGHPVFDRFQAGREATVWYYETLLELFSARMGSSHSVVRQLRNAVFRLKAPPPVEVHT